MTTTSQNALTIFYIVEPPDYQMMACYLLASLRARFPAEVKAIGYCPAHRLHELHPGVIEAHKRMGAEIRTFDSTGRFSPAYPHGNKILAAMEPRDTAFSMFVDSDVLFIKDNEPTNLVSDEKVSCSVAASMIWAEQSIWDTIYGALDMDIPPERYPLMRRSRGAVIPYFSSGLVAFPENDVTGKGRFPDVWYETAQILDRVDTLDRRRPYLDQMSLTAAIRRAGLDWNILPEAQHYIMGGKLKGQQLPDSPIYTIHYRTLRNLRAAGLLEEARRNHRRFTGKRAARKLVVDP